MKKRLVIWMLLLSLLLTACGGETPNKTKEKAEPENETAQETKTEEAIQSTVEQEDPAADGELDVLIIGNSFSTGWPDELKGLFVAAGLKLNIYSVYYSGCRVEQHWNWLQEDAHNYRLNHHLNDLGNRKAVEGKSLVECLSAENWDVISLQQHFGPTTAIDYKTSLDSCTPYAKDLLDYLKWNFPKSKLFWHQTWAYEVGWKNDDGLSIPDVAYQTKCYENIRDVSQKIAKDNGVALVPCGDAWQYARQSAEIVNLTRDNYHDGPEGGGQYLNACTWFECLTGQSCLGNTWKPPYTLDEYKIAALQDAAHRAVEENTIK